MVMPAGSSISDKKVLRVITVANFPERISCAAVSKIRRCNSSEKCSGRKKSDTRSKASLLTSIAPSKACSASILLGGVRYFCVSPSAIGKLRRSANCSIDGINL